MKVTLSILSLVAAGVLAWYGLEQARRPIHVPDLSISSVSVAMDTDLHARVVARIASRSARPPGPIALEFSSPAWGVRRVGPIAIAAAGTKDVSWVSPPLAPGSPYVTVSIVRAAGEPDADESNDTRTVLASMREGNVSRSGRSVRVPSVIGDSRARAIREMRDAGLRISALLDHSSGAPTGRVDLQAPLPNSRVPAGTPAALMMGARAPVPDVQRLRLEDARRALQGQGLAIGRLTLLPALPWRKAEVIRQAPPPATSWPITQGVALEAIAPAPAWPFAAAAALALASLLAIGATWRTRRRSTRSPAAVLPAPIPFDRRGADAIGTDVRRFLPETLLERDDPDAFVECQGRVEHPVEVEPGPNAGHAAQVEAAPTFEPPIGVAMAPDPMPDREAVLGRGPQVVPLETPPVPFEVPFEDEPEVVPHGAGPVSWEPHWDAGTPEVTWHPETAQPALRFVLESGAPEAHLREHVARAAGRESA